MDWRGLQLTGPERRFCWLCDIIAYYEPAYRYRPDINEKISKATESLVRAADKKIVSGLADYRQGGSSNSDIPESIFYEWACLIMGLYPHTSRQQVEAVVPVLHEFLQQEVESRRIDFRYDKVSVGVWHPFLLVKKDVQGTGLHYRADLSTSVEPGKEARTIGTLMGLAIPAIFHGNEHCLVVPESVMNRACRRLFSMDDPPLRPVIKLQPTTPPEEEQVYHPLKPITGNLSSDRERQYYNSQFQEITHYLAKMRGLFPGHDIGMKYDFSYVLNLSQEDRRAVPAFTPPDLG